MNQNLAINTQHSITQAYATTQPILTTLSSTTPRSSQTFDNKEIKPTSTVIHITPLNDEFKPQSSCLSTLQNNMRQVYNNNEKKLLLLGVISLAMIQGTTTFYPKWCTNRAGSKLSQIEPPKEGNENWYHQTAFLSILIDAITTLTWPLFKEISSQLVNRTVYNNLEKHTPLGLNHTSTALRELNDKESAEDIQKLIPGMQKTINSFTTSWSDALLQAKTKTGQDFAKKFIDLKKMEKHAQALSKLPNTIKPKDISTKTEPITEEDAQDIQKIATELKLTIETFKKEWSNTLSQAETKSGKAFAREFTHLKNIEKFADKLSELPQKIDPEQVKTMKFQASQFAKTLLYTTTTAVLSSPLMPSISAPLFALRQNAHIGTCRNFSNFAQQVGTDSNSIAWLYAGYPHLIYRNIFEVPSFFVAHFTLTTLVQSLLLNPAIAKLPALKPHEDKIKFVANMPISAAAMVVAGLAGWYPESQRIAASLSNKSDDDFWPTFWNSFAYNLPSLAMIGFYLGPIMLLSNTLADKIKASKSALPNQI